MNDPLTEELLSAYLDGELPDAERAGVEQWLTASAEHRRLLDDLQAIRRELQALPRQSLDAGFSERVLAAIRERTSEPNSGSAAGAGGSDSPTTTPPEPPSALSTPKSAQPGHLGMPAWRWFAAGVAATLAALFVGINAAPETMARVGSLAQVRTQESVQQDGTRTTPEAATARPAAPIVNAPDSRHVDDPVAMSGQVRRDSVLEDEAVSPATSSDKPRLAAPAETDQRGDVPPADALPRAEKSFTRPVPSLARSASPSPGTADDAPQSPQQEGESPPLAAAYSAPNDAAALREYAEEDEVAELPVTSQQVDRAFSLAGDVRYSAPAVSFEGTLDSGAGGGQPAAGGLARQRFASGQQWQNERAQIAAIEVTGTEDQVHSLLDSLDVEEARYLQRRKSLAGGDFAKRAAAAGPVAAGAAPPAADALSEPVASPPAPPKPAAYTNRASKKFRGGAAPGNAGPGLPGGSGLGGLADADRAHKPQPESLDSAQRQLRVRLVIVPTGDDPIGPTIGVEPQE